MSKRPSTASTTDVDGIAESFTNFWQAVASFFKDEPNVIGYELLNEPNPGTLD